MNWARENNVPPDAEIVCAEEVDFYSSSHVEFDVITREIKIS